MLAFNNYTLAYVNIVYYQITRSLSIIFSAIFSYYKLGIKTSFMAFFACTIVFISYVIGDLGGLQPSKNKTSNETVKIIDNDLVI